MTVAIVVASPAWLGQRLLDNRHALSAPLPGLVDDLVAFLSAGDSASAAADTWAWPAALRLGEQRFRQGESVHALLREFELFGDVIDEFIEREIDGLDNPAPGVGIVKLMRAVSHGIEAAEQQAVRSFMSEYSAAIEEQNRELRNLSRMVGHDMRKPLSVLQVLPQVLHVPEGDFHTTRMVDVLVRNVVRLAAVSHRLERLSRGLTLFSRSPKGV